MDSIIEWNPWTGCRYTSSGCVNCQFCNSKQPAKFNKTQFYLPVRQTRKYSETLGKNTMQYKIPSGSRIKVCERSDFFISDANYYRKRAWRIIQERKDVLFVVTTKHLENFYINLPDTYTFDNLFLGVSVEDQYTADIRIKELLKLPVKHRFIEISPLLSGVDIKEYLATGLIDEVIVAGESLYKSSSKSVSKCNFSTIKDIANQCRLYDVNFIFKSTGSRFFKDGVINYISDIKEQQVLAEFISESDIKNNNKKPFDWEMTLEDLESIELVEKAAYIHKLYNKGRKNNGNK